MDDVVNTRALWDSRAARPTREEAEAAVRTLIAWTGDDPEREGLIDTPRRVVKAYEELYGGYREEAGDALGGSSRRSKPTPTWCWCATSRSTRTANITWRRSSARRISAITGRGRRWDLQARAHCRDIRPPPANAGGDDCADRRGDRKGPAPRGVAIMIEAEHSCMAMRGVKKHGASTVTTQFAGAFAITRRSRPGSSLFCAEPDSPMSLPAISKKAGFLAALLGRWLVTCVTVDAGDGAVLMVAHMNAEALAKTLSSGSCTIGRARAANSGAKATPPGRSRRSWRCASIAIRRAAGSRPRRRRRRRLPHRTAIVLLPPRRDGRGKAWLVEVLRINRF